MQLFPPSPQTFQSAYEAMVEKVLALFDDGAEKPVVPVLHVCGGEPKPCESVKAAAAALNSSSASIHVYSTGGDYGQGKEGCVGHRSAEQQARVAAFLEPVVAGMVGV